jgi:hypothetical protein
VTCSVYLLRFPVRLAVLKITAYRGLRIDCTHLVAFILFAGSVFLISVPTLYLFERQVQSYLRSMLLAQSGVRLPAT